MDQDENYNDRLRQSRLGTLVLIIVIAALLWGFVGSVDSLIISWIQYLFPSMTQIQYGFLQIFVYVLLLAIVVYFTDMDVSNVFLRSDHLKLSETTYIRDK